MFDKHSWTCQYCRNTKIRLELHHLDYISGVEPWDYPDDMLLTLCYVCHDKERGRVELEKSLANTFKMKGFLFGELKGLREVH